VSRPVSGGHPAFSNPQGPTLWYSEPAGDDGDEALPIGNGQLGAMVFGGVVSERLRLSEKTMRWGQPSATLGDLFVHVHDAGIVVDDYRRDLDLGSAIARVEYVLDGVRYRREHLASHPARVIVSRFQASQPSKLSLTVEFRPSQKGVSVDVHDGRITARGASPTSGLRYETQVLVVAEDGALHDGEDSVTVWEARAVTVLVSAATDYVPGYPTYRGKDPHRRVTRRINTAAAQPYPTLRAVHVADHRRLFDRVALDVGQPAVTDVPTDQALATYDGVRPRARAVEALYFHYGRYLAIASSREGTPAVTPACGPHGSRATSGTLDLVDWPVHATNLTETALPLFDTVDGLGLVHRAGDVNRTPGWHPHGSPWECARRGHRRFLETAAWLCQHVWEHYEFSADQDFLRTEAYPVLATVAAIWLDILADGPSDEPSRTVPAHAQVWMSRWGVWDVLRHTLIANEVLDEDPEFRKRLVDTLDRFDPATRVGATSRAATVDPVDTQRSLRHPDPLLHLGTVPSAEVVLAAPEPDEPVTPIPRPRVPDDVDPTKAWHIDRWARLGHGDHAHRLVRDLLRELTPPNLMGGLSPFHAEGTVRVTAAMTHMLLQSQWSPDETVVHLLPALPTAWRHGRVSGLRARGGLTVDVAWRDSRPVHIELATRQAVTLRLRAQAFATLSYDVMDLATGRVAPHSREGDEVRLRADGGQVLRLTPTDGGGR